MDGDGVRRAFWLLRSVLRVGRGECEATQQRLLQFSRAFSCRVSQQSFTCFHEGFAICGLVRGLAFARQMLQCLPECIVVSFNSITVGVAPEDLRSPKFK